MKSDSNRPITLEDLLRLKRAERPPGEFWGEFDRKLREKQLAALVAKRPWWQRLPQVWPTFVRYRVALGATAVVALTVVSLRDTSEEAISDSPLGSTAAVVSGAGFAPVVAAVTIEEPVVDAAVDSSSVASLAKAEVQEPVLDVVRAESLTPREVTRLVALGGGNVAEPEMESLSPANRVIAANLAELRSSEQSSTVRLLGSTNGFEARAMPTRVTVEPLQQITPPSESRRSRLLTAMVATSAIEASARSTDRAVSRLEEERLYDQIQRFGAKGDRFNFRF